MIKRRPEDETVPLPAWATADFLVKWASLGFDLCFLPELNLIDYKFPTSWSDRPTKFFYRLIEEDRLPKEAAQLSGKWLLVDNRDKPVKRNFWVSRSETLLFEKIGLRSQNWFKNKKGQEYTNDYLLSILHQAGFATRFCLSFNDIEKLKSLTAEILGVSPYKIRLPNFVEYNFLGNNFYPEWSKTKTWEWLQDQVDNSHLASGCGSVGELGLDPSDYWSTILGFRFVIEL
jgi:hypothetical protein